MGDNKQSKIAGIISKCSKGLERFKSRKEISEAKAFSDEFTNLWQSFWSILVIFAPIVTVSGFILSRSQNSRQIQFVLIVGNLVVLITWFFALTFFKPLKNHYLKLKANENKNYCDLLNVNDPKLPVHYTDRVNKLIGQLKNCISGYAVCLIIVYGAFLFDNGCLGSEAWAQCGASSELPYSNESLHKYLKIIEDLFNLFSAAFLYLGFKVLYNQTLRKNNKRKVFYIDAVGVCFIIFLAYIGHNQSTSSVSNALPSNTIATIANTTNDYMGNANKKAVDSLKNINEKIANAKIVKTNNAEDNNANTNVATNNNKTKSNTNKNGNLKTTDSNNNANISNTNSNSTNEAALMKQIKEEADKYDKTVNQDAKEKIKEAIKAYELETNNIGQNILGLIIGSLNGLAMCLLFGRYISMDHVINNTKEKNFYNLFAVCTIFLLPVYALAQPLFGAFEINAFGDSKAFANCVFFVCLAGKIFFFIFTYKFIKERKMHYYLHLMIASHDIHKNLVNFFEVETNNREILEESHSKNQQLESTVNKIMIVSEESQKENLRKIFGKMKEVEMFGDIKDVKNWQKEMRDEWE